MSASSNHIRSCFISANHFYSCHGSPHIILVLYPPSCFPELSPDLSCSGQFLFRNGRIPESGSDLPVGPQPRLAGFSFYTLCCGCRTLLFAQETDTIIGRGLTKEERCDYEFACHVMDDEEWLHFYPLKNAPPPLY